MNDIEFKQWRITYLEQQKKDRLLLRLDHEKAMQKARLDHETEVYKYKLEIEKLKAETVSKSSTRSTKSSSEESKKSFSEEDMQFNQETLYNEAKECHLGKLSKTPAWSASRNKADKLDRLLLNSSQFTKYKILLPEEDLKKYRTKGLITAILWAHSMSTRAARWPDAPDMDLVSRVLSEITAIIDKYEGQTIKIIMDFLKEVWKDEVSSVDMDTTLIGDYIDKACEEYLKTSCYLDEVRMENSPFVKAVVEKLTEIDPEFRPEILINHLKATKLKDLLCKKKSQQVSFYMAHHYYKYIVHPFYRDTHDEDSWAKEHEQNKFKLRDELLKILEPIEDAVQDEYVKYENLRRKRGVIDKVW